MKMLNNISRSQAIYRHQRISASDIQPGQYAFVLSICRRPGRSQEELARELCINKSTAARTLASLEEKGYILREPLPSDRRQFAVMPTERMLALVPEVEAASESWMAALSEGISDDEMEIFSSVLLRMQDKARALLEANEIK